MEEFRDREERGEVRRARRAEEWEERGGLEPYPYICPLSPISFKSRPTLPGVRFQRFRIPPQTQFGDGNGVCGTLGKSGEEIGTVTLLMRTLPNLFPIFPVSKVSVGSYPTPNTDGCWKWDALQKKKEREQGEEWEDVEEWGGIGP